VPATGLFQVQNASSFAVFTVNTSTNQAVLGTSSHVNGSLTFDDSGDSNTIGFTAASGGTLNTTTTGAGTSTFGASTSSSYVSIGSAVNNEIDCSLFNFASRQNATVTSMTVYTGIGASVTNKAYDVAVYTGDVTNPLHE